ncbi:MAG: rod shape-determining protein MreC, partial [Hydrogenobacter sp.]
MVIYIFLISLSLLIYFSNLSSSRYFSFLYNVIYSLLTPMIELKTHIANAVSNSVNRYIYL